jgi:hypothetical protein
MAEWRDAQGTFVGPVITPQVIIHFDARGLLWFVDVNGQFQVGSEDVMYDAVGCTGNAYVRDGLPRLVFTAEGATSTYRTLPDAYTPVSVQVRSFHDGGECTNTTSPQEHQGIPLADTLPATPIVKPAVSFVGPIRLSVK